MLANGLRDLGHHVTFLVMHADAPGDVSLRPRLRPDIPVLTWRECQSRFDRIVKDFGFDVINSHNVEVEYEFFRRGISPAVPYVATLHGGYETVPEIMTTPFTAYLARRATTVIYTADRNRDVLVGHGLTEARWRKGFNAVAPAALAGSGSSGGVRRTLTLSADAILLGLASRAIPEKGWDIAIDVTRRVRAATGRDVRLVLVGDGDHLPAIRELAKEAPYVHLWGRTSDVSGILRECDLALFPTTYPGESFPLFLLECFGAGLPVVATDVGSIREMLADEDGGVAGAVVTLNGDRAQTAEDMAAAVQSMLPGTESHESAARRARRRSVHYSVGRMVELYLDTFLSLSRRSSADLTARRREA
jgi:glycosyltransferase involved in cell wall biosynthesis